MTAATVMATMPLCPWDTATAMGVVTDLGSRETVISRSRPNRRHMMRMLPTEVMTPAALVVILIGDVEHRQHRDQQRHSDDHVVADHKAGLLLDLDAHPVHQHRQRDAEGRGCIQFTHFAASFFVSSSFRVRCTAVAVAP